MRPELLKPDFSGALVTRPLSGRQAWLPSYSDKWPHWDRYSGALTGRAPLRKP